MLVAVARDELVGRQRQRACLQRFLKTRLGVLRGAGAGGAAAFEEPARQVSVVYPSARLLPLRTRVFIEWLRQELSATLKPLPAPA